MRRPAARAASTGSTPSKAPMIVAMEAGEPGNVGGQPSPAPGAGGPGAAAGAARRRRTLRWGIVGLAVIVAVVAWLVTRNGGDGESEPAEPASAGFGARIVDEAELAKIAAAAGHPVYWAGLIDGKELEASETKDGNVQVRYLDEGAKLGTEKKQTLTIGSYPVADPAKALDGYANRKGAIVERAPDGRKLVSSTELPTSVYFASPDNSVQVEIYVPSYKRAMSLARSGKVQPVG